MSNNDVIISAVIRKLCDAKITLQVAKQLVDAVENDALSKGLKIAIAVCNQFGNMVAVESMDGAFLASFDIAIKKAYTSAALQTKTIDLGQQAAPGQPLYGLDRLDCGNIVIIGGGVPLAYKGNILGGLGISGGTPEEDHAIAQYGAEKLISLLAAK